MTLVVEVAVVVATAEEVVMVEVLVLTVETLAIETELPRSARAC